MVHGMAVFKDPMSLNAVEHSAQYIIRKGSRDIGKHTLEGSRPGMAMLVHSALRIIGRRGYELLIDSFSAGNARLPAGGDTLIGGAGPDVLVGGTGDDLFVGDRSEDTFIGFTPADLDPSHPTARADATFGRTRPDPSRSTWDASGPGGRGRSRPPGSSGRRRASSARTRY